MNSPSKQCPVCKGEGQTYYASSNGGVYLSECLTCKGTGRFITEDRPEPEGGQPAVTQAARRSLPALAVVHKVIDQKIAEARSHRVKMVAAHLYLSAHNMGVECAVLLEVRKDLSKALSEEPEGNGAG